VGIRIKKVAWP
jgi:hypothetical protein